MVTDNWLRPLKLNISLLLNIRAKAVREAGAILSLPIQITVFVFIAILLYRFKFRPDIHMSPNVVLRPSMVRRQFSFAYGKRWLTIKRDRCNIAIESYNRSTKQRGGG